MIESQRFVLNHDGGDETFTVDSRSNFAHCREARTVMMVMLSSRLLWVGAVIGQVPSYRSFCKDYGLKTDIKNDRQ